MKLSIFEIQKTRLSLQYEAREFIAVGDDVFSMGRIGEEKLRAIEDSIVKMKQQIRPGDSILAAATSAFRESSNGEAALPRLEERLGAKILLLDQLEEAALIAEGVLEEQGAERAAVLDIGGGSVELIRRVTKNELDLASFDLGAIRLRELFAKAPDDLPPPQDALAAIDDYARNTLEAIVPLPNEVALYGSGGGFTTLGDIVYGQDNRSGISIDAETLRKTAAIAQRLSAHELAAQFNLPLHRARIIPAGAIVALRAMERLQSPKVIVSWAGLREGLAWRHIRLEQYPPK